MALPALAQGEQTAEQFLRSIYDKYKGKDAKASRSAMPRPTIATSRPRSRAS
jgi:hypothetical protein